MQRVAVIDVIFFFFYVTAHPWVFTLSLPHALPIWSLLFVGGGGVVPPPPRCLPCRGPSSLGCVDVWSSDLRLGV